MKTGCYFTYQGPGRIGITVGSPRRVPAGFKLYRPLAPRRDMLMMPYGLFRATYFREILGPLDPQEQWDVLHVLSAEWEPVLLCFERPPFTSDNWCHRRMAAEWFGDRLGFDILELQVHSFE